MRRIKQSILLYVLLSKRFLKKISFLLLLLAVPVLVLCLKNVSCQESGILHIAICLEDKEDETAARVAAELMSEESVLYYSMVENQETAKKLVQDGEVDAAWIFRSDFREKIEKLTEKEMEGEAPILVLEQEDNVALQLSRIKLFGSLYPDLSFALYRNFARDDLSVGEEVSEDNLRELYEMTNMERNLFRVACLDSEEQEGASPRSLLTAPLRGMLALLVILGGLSTGMLFLQDEEKGVLDGVSLRKRGKRLYFYQLAAMVPIAVAVLCGLYLSGEFKGMGREILLMILYLADCMVFCNLFRKICGTAGRLGTCIPILMLGMFVLCPVFVNLGKFRPLQYLLPPFYYLSALGDGRWIKGMLCYGIVGTVINLLISRVKER